MVYSSGDSSSAAVIYVADWGNGVIRSISPNGTVSTIKTKLVFESDIGVYHPSFLLLDLFDTVSSAPTSVVPTQVPSPPILATANSSAVLSTGSLVGIAVAALVVLFLLTFICCWRRVKLAKSSRSGREVGAVAKKHNQTKLRGPMIFGSQVDTCRDISNLGAVPLSASVEFSSISQRSRPLSIQNSAIMRPSSSLATEQSAPGSVDSDGFVKNPFLSY